MKSIQQKSMVLLSALALLVMAVTFSVSYALVASYFDNALEKQMDDADRTLSIVLKEPIFSYDAALTSNILSSFISAPYIHEIKAFDHRDKQIGEAQADTESVAPEDLSVRQLDILWDGDQKIGHLEVTYRLDSNDELLMATRLMLLLMAIILLVALLAANWLVLRRYVVAPVKQVAQAMAEIAQGGGDLTRRLSITSRDEIGELATSFNKFVSNLQALMQRIVGSAEQLSQCAEEIKGNASHNTNAVQRQQQEIELVATSLNQMSSTTQEVSANANLTAEKTQQCSESATSGSQIVGETVKKINVLGEEIDLTSDKITELKDKSNHITTVLDVIKGIAEQTNLLALNAAIEAARAGEQGRGFAVVADEVRALAQRTQTSTEEIEGIIKGLQSSSEEASQFMIATRTSLGTTISESHQASSALENIIANIQIINDMNAQVAASTEEQSSVARDVSEKIVSINDITELVTGNADKVTQLSAQLDGVSASIKQDLAHFKL